MHHRKPASARGADRPDEKAHPRLRTLLNHRYVESHEIWRKRKDCPFEVSLLRRLTDATSETVMLAEACLEELRRQEAMFYAPFKPGDCVSIEFEDARKEKRVEYKLVADVTPGKRSGDFYYEVRDLTKAGTVSKRGWTHPLNPRLDIKRAEPRLNEEWWWYANYYREAAKVSRILAFERGDLTMFEPVKGYFGVSSYRRADRTSVEPTPSAKPSSG